MNKLLAGGALTGALMFGAACGETSPNVPATSVTMDDLFDSNAMTIIKPGQSVVVDVETSEGFRNRIRKDIQLVDHQYPHGLTDSSAPQIGQVPIRVDAHFSVVEDKEVNNDLACDTLRVNTGGLSETNVYIGALALSEEENDRVVLSWPLASDGGVSKNIYLCMDDGNEPANGVVLVANDQLR